MFELIFCFLYIKVPEINKKQYKYATTVEFLKASFSMKLLTIFSYFIQNHLGLICQSVKVILGLSHASTTSTSEEKTHLYVKNVDRGDKSVTDKHVCRFTVCDLTHQTQEMFTTTGTVSCQVNVYSTCENFIVCVDIHRIQQTSCPFNWAS